MCHRNLVLTDTSTGQVLASYANLFPFQPTEPFRRDVLGPLLATPAVHGYLPGFFNYTEALLNRQGIYGEAMYSKGFFTPSNAHEHCMRSNHGLCCRIPRI